MASLSYDPFREIAVRHLEACGLRATETLITNLLQLMREMRHEGLNEALQCTRLAIAERPGAAAEAALLACHWIEMTIAGAED